MPNLALPTSSSEDINIIPLLCIGGQSSRIELLQFPDGLLAFEHYWATIHVAMPTADRIYISLHDESQLEGIQVRLNSPAQRYAPRLDGAGASSDKYHHSSGFPALEPIFDLKEHDDIGPAAGLLATHVAHPAAKLLVLRCDYPLLPPAALHQLLLEYEPPLTCFLNAEGFTEPLIAVWSLEALDALAAQTSEGRVGLNRVVGMLKGKMVRPLRDEWITGCNTRKEWEEALNVLQQRDGCRQAVTKADGI